MKKIMVVVILAVLFQCQPANQNDTASCEWLNQKTHELTLGYAVWHDFSYLDSALVLLEEALEKCPDQWTHFAFRKLAVLAQRRQFSEAVMFIESFGDTVIVSLPYYKELLRNRFLAMEAHYIRDTLKRDSYLKLIVADLESFIDLHKDEIESLLKTPDRTEFMANPYYTPLVQYYYYKGLLFGLEETEEEYISLRKSHNPMATRQEIFTGYFESDLLDFIGL